MRTCSPLRWGRRLLEVRFAFALPLGAVVVVELAIAGSLLSAVYFGEVSRINALSSFPTRRKAEPSRLAWIESVSSALALRCLTKSFTAAQYTHPQPHAQPLRGSFVCRPG
jgi:hypothetical protein